MGSYLNFTRTGLITALVLFLSLCIALGVLAASGLFTGVESLLWIFGFVAFFSLLYVLKTRAGPRSSAVLLGSLLIGLLLVGGCTVRDPSGTATALEMIISVFVFLLLIYRLRMGREKQDERSIRTGTYALSCSWYLTIVLVALLAWLTSVMQVNMDTGLVLSVLLVVMFASAVIGQQYFNVRGDI